MSQLSCANACNDTTFMSALYNKTGGYSLKITDGQPVGNTKLSPPINTVINSYDDKNGSNGNNGCENNDYRYCNCQFKCLLIEIYSEANAQGYLIGTANVIMTQNDQQVTFLLDTNNLLVFTYNDGESYYNNSKGIYVRGEDITAPSIADGPPIVTNKGWNSGMGNEDSEPDMEESFWMQDYGSNEQGRWTTQNGAIAQGTQLIGQNSGSRAYPAYIANKPPYSPTWVIKNCCNGKGDIISNCQTTYPPSCDNIVAPGTAWVGCWQIDMHCGSNSNSPFCETFYLAERECLVPNPENYQDGNENEEPAGGYGREIDIMETHWTDGPQSNCPWGGNTYWTQSFHNQQMGKWTDITKNGLPMNTGDFASFGCLIRDTNLWIYGYKPDGSQWYSSGPIAEDNTWYKQNSPFVPYIGTWCLNNPNTAGNFKTLYKNFIYLEQNDPLIYGLDPQNNPDAFGPALVKAIYPA